MRHFLSTAVVVGAIAVMAGCPTTTATADDDIICTPDNFVLCYCEDLTKGTKLCKKDGTGFGACGTRDGKECSEVKGKDTNKKVDGNGDVIPGQGDDDDDVVSGDDDDTDPGPGELDVCPGKPIAVAPGNSILLEGDTSRATGDRRGKVGGACAASLGAKDFIYHLIPSGTGSIDIKVQGQGALDPIVYVRTTCDDETTQKGCGPQSGNKVASTKVQVVTGRDYFLFIDGASGGSGAYTATLKLTTGIVCGDGQVDTGEACDDGNNASGDGCNDNCRQVDGDPVAASTCPGQTVNLWKGSTVLGKGSTTAKNTLGTPNPDTCVTLPASGSNTSTDHVYQVIPHSTGTLTVKLNDQETGQAAPPAGMFVSAHPTCSATAPTSSCATGTTAMVLNVDANEPVFIAVDGGAAAGQKYQVSFKLQ